MMAEEQEEGAHFSAVAQIVRQLRAPGGCPWDRRQSRHRRLTLLAGDRMMTL